MRKLIDAIRLFDFAFHLFWAWIWLVTLLFYDLIIRAIL